MTNPIHSAALSARDPKDGVLPELVGRWSPRAMDGTALSEEELTTCLEAARWAPSTYNEQEWRFVYARRDTPHWGSLMDCLGEFNQQWCERAGALIVVCSRTTFVKNGKPNPVHEFDAGLATQNLLVQAAAMGLVGHAMAGFERGKTRAGLGIPDEAEPHCMIALGHPAPKDVLSEDLQEKESPSDRKPLKKIAVEGRYAFEE